MTTVVNTHQAQAWNGYEGQHWADEYKRYNQANDGMNQPLLEAAAITGTDRVLDIGCGTGRTTRLAARIATHGHATGIDLSGPMLARARGLAEAEGIGNVTFHQGDAQVYPLPDNGFDVAISRGGVMFFDDPMAAFGNINRALRPAGRLAFVAPKDNSMSGDFARALAPLWHLMRQHAKRSTSPGPTSLGSPDRIAEVLGAAGFTDVDSTSITVGMVFGDNPADAAEFMFAMGPMRFNLDGVAPDDIDHTKAEVIDSLRPYQQAEGVRLTVEMWLVRALAGAR
ncbi:MAG TPA: methyltransferase domain-containing protein [Pseudonocardiaceae bacterium]|nr:methyltransferase domain-containing protein [Pseudonocardiaceae bacterium]